MREWQANPTKGVYAAFRLIIEVSFGVGMPRVAVEASRHKTNRMHVRGRSRNGRSIRFALTIRAIRVLKVLSLQMQIPR